MILDTSAMRTLLGAIEKRVEDADSAYEGADVDDARTVIAAAKDLLATLDVQQTTLEWDTKTIKRLKGEVQQLTDSEDSRAVVLGAENKRLKEEINQLANDLTAAGEALKATAAGYRFSADAQAHLDEKDRLRAENRMLRTKTTRLESELTRVTGERDDALITIRALVAVKP